jgi:hypothetical protein
MKRSASIRLLLLGSLSAGALAGCGSGQGGKPPISADTVYADDSYVAGVGYYHAPFRGWYLLPYNHFDPQARRYFFGGQWADAPHQSITNVSSPTLAAAQLAEAQRTDVARGGFGGSAHGFFVHT